MSEIRLIFLYWLAHYGEGLSLHMNEIRANKNAAPLGARSQQITVNASPVQESALAACAGDRGISQGDVLLLGATMTMNSEPNLSELAD